jgi:peptidoglycan/LPS O-acetylase OafA/YrhL
MAPRSAVKWVLLFFIVAAPALRWLLGLAYAGQGLGEAVIADAVYWNTLSHLDAFFIGGLIPVLSLPSRTANTRLWMVLTGAVALAAGAIDFLATSDLPYLSDLGYAHGKTGAYEHVWHYTVLNFFYASVILHIVRLHGSGEPSLLIRLFETRWLVGIGKVSYGMYLFHWAILVYVFERVFPLNSVWARVLMFIPYAAAVYGVAALSFYLYESRFLKWKDGKKERHVQGVQKTAMDPAAPARPQG